MSSSSNMMSNPHDQVMGRTFKECFSREFIRENHLGYSDTIFTLGDIGLLKSSKPKFYIYNSDESLEDEDFVTRFIRTISAMIANKDYITITGLGSKSKYAISNTCHNNQGKTINILPTGIDSMQKSFYKPNTDLYTNGNSCISVGSLFASSDTRQYIESAIKLGVMLSEATIILSFTHSAESLITLKHILELGKPIFVLNENICDNRYLLSKFPELIPSDLMTIFKLLNTQHPDIVGF